MARGTVEIVPDVEVVAAGTRAVPSGAALPKILNNSPFTYGMTIVQISDSGNVLVSHLLAKARKNLISVSIATNHTFEGSGKVEEFLADPEAFAVAAITGETVAAPAEEEEGEDESR